MDRVVIDCTTGEEVREPLTADEIADRTTNETLEADKRAIEEARAARHQEGLDAYHDLVETAKDKTQTPATRRIARNTALAIRALMPELQDDTSI